MAGLLDVIKEKAKQQYQQGLLNQVLTNPASIGAEIGQLFNPEYMSQVNPMTQEQAMDVALSAPMMAGTIKPVDIYKQLEKANKYTTPKVPVENVFYNKYELIPENKKELINNVIGTKEELSLPFKSVDINKIIPTQKNVTIPNLKNVSKIKNYSDDIVAVENNGKYYLIDGHHRIANDILNMQKTAKIRVLE